MASMLMMIDEDQLHRLRETLSFFNELWIDRSIDSFTTTRRDGDRRTSTE